MQSGSNIASLVPTTLALIGNKETKFEYKMNTADNFSGVRPIEIVKLALACPLRGLVLCVFGIGLPQGLFRQFSPHRLIQPDKQTSDPRVQRWIVPVPTNHSAQGLWWLGPMRTVAIDIVFLALLAVMLWQNVTLGLQIVISWRCDYSFLLICWPIACVMWLMIAMMGLLILAKKIRIQHSEDPEGWERSWPELVQYPYKWPQSEYSRGVIWGENSEARKSRGLRDQAFEVEITMRFDYAWEYYEAGIEILAVGIYLYATFVLTSSLFVSGQTAIIYMTVMVCCLSTIRVLLAIA
ncbi:hypothetical protein BGW36DRAFT_369351 [Talaromyces proteolyticus]|uniref:Uncharacterized protein n=1 Tax=Talaromyces proteolyticus TaxID=1131652 RepID=A0AAD4KYR9_9EURO|nr:uncharacterized protein BGW36DRAFT_369351 [Talaromyces proteolyticus]KAH8703447.1 hypothetical protein BGW36DRAFT_369351 [Talaromyces proteolyticus]